MQLMPVNKPNHRTLIRDISVLQVKLFADGLRDLILVPLSIGAGVLSLLRTDDGPGTQFYDLLRAGRRSDRWINLFGAADRVHGPASDDGQLPLDDIDEIITHVESFVVNEYKSGGFTAETKNQLDRAFDLLRKHGPGGEL
jgi:hypothetical protein